MCHMLSERDCSGEPAALEVKPGVNGYFGAVGRQTDATVVSNADFGLWELESFPAAMVVSRAVSAAMVVSRVPARQPETVHQALGWCQTSSGQRGTPSGQ